MVSAGPLQASRLATPLATAAVFGAVRIVEIFSGPKSRARPDTSSVWQSVFYPACILASTILIEIAVRIYININTQTTEPDDVSLIGLLLDGLVWLSLALLLLVATQTSWKPYAISATTSAVLHTINLALCLTDSSSTETAVIAVECARILLLVALTAACVFAQHRSNRIQVADETEPLLGSSESAEHDRASTLADDEDGSDNSSDGFSDDDSDSSEEAFFSEKRQKAVKDKGGFWSYLREFKIFWPYIWPGRNVRLQAYLLIVLASTLAQRAVNVLYARQLGILVEHLFKLYGTGGPLPWQDIVLWLFYEFLYSYSCGLPALNEWLESRISNWSSMSLRVAAFDHVMGLDMSWRDSSDTGEVMKAVDQAGSLASLLHVIVFETAPVLLDITVALWYVSHLLDIYASIIVLYMGVAFVFATYFISIVMKNARRKSAADGRTQNRIIYEIVGNWSTVAYFNRRQYEQRRLASTVKTSVASSQWDNDISLCLFAVQQVIEILGLLAVSILAAYKVVFGQIPASNFISVEQYWDVITTPLWVFGHSFRSLSSDLIDAERLLELFQQTSSIKDGPKTMPSHISGAIEFSNVSFAYEAERPVVSDLSFTAEPGQTIAIVGETGSGKSTTMKLLMRFYDVTSGSIKISGIDVRDVTLSSFREIFGFVPQSAVLFNETIMDNVRYGRLDATDDEVYAACRAASIHERIIGFPKGYRTKVGERGVKLSGGELQRISIARVILKDPQIVLLDEATSALDTETEFRIQGALKTLTDGRTTIVIAHRLSTVVNADQILVMDKGRIVERGTHMELLELSGKYRDYWAKQSNVAGVEKGKKDGALEE
jgi:ABC-type transport system involved in Fe-S cluster assembly fused permease/ATPase subunit